jgi:RND family efflux transporter MFP subunit
MRTEARGGFLYVLGAVLVAAIAVLVFMLARARHDAAANERAERERAFAAGPPVLVATVAPAPPRRTLNLPGDVRAYRQATLYSKVSGYLKEIRVDRGDNVKQNDILGVVAAPETDRQLSSLENELAAKRAIAARLKALVPTGVASQQELDRAEADVHTVQAEVDRLVAVRGFDVIRAPFDGTITARYADPGALLPAATGATQSAQPLVDIADESRVRVVVYLGQLEAPFVKEGDACTVVRDADPTRPIPAKITRTARALDPRTRTMWVEVELDNHERLLFPGLFVHVEIAVAAPPGLVVPADAVFLRGGAPQVAVIAGGRARFVPVTLGDDDGKSVRVLAGLQAGDEVALHVGDDVSDGGAVQVVEPAKK